MSENIRYFFSAAAQSIAAIVAIIFVLFPIISSKIPNYEIIFQHLYSKIQEKYYELQKSKKLLILAGIFIFFSLASLLFISENVIFVYPFVVLNLFLLSFLLLELVLFFLEAFKWGKEKFFKDCEFLIENKLRYDDCKLIADQIYKFVEEKDDVQYSELMMDYDKIVSLLNSILLKFGKCLLNEQKVGEIYYYDSFKSLLSYVFDERIHDLIWVNTYRDFSKNFKVHIAMCINKSSKYIPDTLSIIDMFITGFMRTHNPRILEQYFYILQDISKDLLAKGFKHNVDVLLYSISKNMAYVGIRNYDLLVKLLNELGYETKEKIVYLEKIETEFEEYKKETLLFPATDVIFKKEKEYFKDADSFAQTLKIDIKKLNELVN